MPHLGYPPRVKIRGTKEYAGMMKLVNIQDLGDVTSVKVFHFVTRTEKLNTRA